MNVYSIALFLHIVGALGYISALSMEWTGLRHIRSAANPAQVRPWMGIFMNSSRMGFASMLTTIITGIYMVLTEEGGAAWVFVTLGALVLLILLAATLTAPRMEAIGQTLAMENGSLSKNFHNLANHPVLWISIQTRVAIALGIVFLKATKPDLVGSLLAIGIAILLGLASTLQVTRGEQAHEESSTNPSHP